MPQTATTAGTKTPKSRAPSIPPVICFRLSDKYFADCGWTAQPYKTKGIPFVMMRARFSHPMISPWFKERSENLKVKYSNGRNLYYARADGTGKIFYPNGRLAVKIEKGGINRYRTRIWVYSPGIVEKDGLRHPPGLCGLFDSFGCGVVYDHCMNKRLVYNQSEGVWLDTPRPVRWKWHSLQYTGTLSVMNDEDSESVMIPEFPNRIVGASPHKESEIPSKTSMVTSTSSQKLTHSEIEFREMFEMLKYVNTDKIIPRRVSPLKPIVVRLNAYIALKIWNQSEISLSFFALGRHTQLRIGILYNPFDKLKVTQVDESYFQEEKVICPFEHVDAKTVSMIEFQKTVKNLRDACVGYPPGPPG